VTRVSRDAVQSTPTDLVKLDRDGNVVWARELPDATNLDGFTAHAAVTADGGVVLMSTNGTGPVYTIVDALDADGAALDRVQMEGGLQETATLFDATGKAFAFTGAEDVSYLYVFQRNPSGCTMHSIEAPPCFVASDGTQLGCDGPSAVFTPSGDLLYGMADSVGVVDLP
jgi:hypothetical protein